MLSRSSRIEKILSDGVGGVNGCGSVEPRHLPDGVILVAEASDIHLIMSSRVLDSSWIRVVVVLSISSIKSV